MAGSEIRTRDLKVIESDTLTTRPLTPTRVIHYIKWIKPMIKMKDSYNRTWIIKTTVERKNSYVKKLCRQSDTENIGNVWISVSMARLREIRIH